MAEPLERLSSISSARSLGDLSQDAPIPGNSQQLIVGHTIDHAAAQFQHAAPTHNDDEIQHVCVQEPRALSPESEERTGFQPPRLRHSRSSVNLRTGLQPPRLRHTPSSCNLKTAMTNGEGDLQKIQESEPTPHFQARCILYLLIQLCAPEAHGEHSESNQSYLSSHEDNPDSDRRSSVNDQHLVGDSSQVVESASNSGQTELRRAQEALRALSTQ
jgi:hypothetical protein